jgi:hypothetical protein
VITKEEIGSEFVYLAVKRAKAANKIPLSLYSEPQAYRFFKKLGYKDVDFADIDFRKWGTRTGYPWGIYVLGDGVSKYVSLKGGPGRASGEGYCTSIDL